MSCDPITVVTSTGETVRACPPHLRKSPFDRLIGAGRASEAVPLARRFLAEAMAAGEAAYEGAAYDLVVCHFWLGRALKESGEAQAALVPIEKARARFQSLADADNPSAALMASVCLTDRADALL